MKKAIGAVSYDVVVDCPHCENNLYLNQRPYNQDDEDKLGKTVFGSIDTPGKWSGINIIYKCFFCKKEFILDGLEY